MNEQNPATLELGIATRRDADTVRLRLNLGGAELVIDAKLSTAASLAGAIASALAQTGELVKPVPSGSSWPGLEPVVSKTDSFISFIDRSREFHRRVRDGGHAATIAGLLNLHLHFDEATGRGYYVTDPTDKSPSA